MFWRSRFYGTTRYDTSILKSQSHHRTRAPWAQKKCRQRWENSQRLLQKIHAETGNNKNRCKKRSKTSKNDRRRVRSTGKKKFLWIDTWKVWGWSHHHSTPYWWSGRNSYLSYNQRNKYYWSRRYRRTCFRIFPSTHHGIKKRDNRICSKK